MNYRTNLTRKLFRRDYINKVEEKIEYLAEDAKMNANTFTTIHFFTTPIIFISILYLTDLGYIFAPLGSALYYFLFSLIILDLPLKRRIKRLDRDALRFFEILTLTLESGRNLESSLEVTCFNVESELSNEFKKTLFEMKFGNSLLDSLENMKRRIPSEAVNNIILNITQTDIFGSSILETMYNQVEFLRDKQILSVKEQINKIPNKISIISVIFIVPLILLMILGPIGIDFIIGA